MDGEILCECGLIPSIVCFNISKVTHLNFLCQTTVNYDITESCDFIHQFDFNSMRNTSHSEYFSGLIEAFYLKHDVMLERLDALFRPELNFKWV